jgi:hypothetical protein
VPRNDKKKLDCFVPPFGQEKARSLRASLRTKKPYRHGEGLIYPSINGCFLISPKPSHGYGIASLPRNDRRKLDRFVPPFGQKNLTVMARGLIYPSINGCFLNAPKPSHDYGIASLPRFGRKKARSFLCLPSDKKTLPSWRGG